MLLGVRNYSEAADIWSVGCVFAETLRGTPLFAGASQIEQLFLIFEALGTPTDDSWPGVTAAPFFFPRSFPQWQGRKASLTAAVPTATTVDLELLARCLCCCPDLRATAAQLLSHSIWDRVDTSLVENVPGTCGGPQLSAQQAHVREHGGEGLLSRLTWATSVVHPAELRRHAANAQRARWQQLGTMREAEAKNRAREERDAEAAVLQEIRHAPWYQVVLKALVCIHSAKGTDSGGRSLDRAVVLLDGYCVSEAGVLLNDCERSGQSCGGVSAEEESSVSVKDCVATLQSSCEEEDDTDSGECAPLKSTIHHEESAQVPRLANEKEALLRELEVTSAAWTMVVASAVACLQLASKQEDVCYLDTTEIKSLAAAVAATLEGRCGVSEVKATLLLALTEMGEVDGNAVLAAEETVLCANSFHFGGPTVRDFANLYAEEVYLLLRLALAAGRRQSQGGLQGGFGKVHLHIESQSMLGLLAGWDRQTRHRLHREDAGPQSLPLPPWLPFLYSLNDLTITTALLSPDSADFAPSQLAAATVWLTMQMLAEISSKHGAAARCSGTGEGAPLCEHQGIRDVASESSRVTEGSCPRAVRLRGVLTAALQTWSGYTEGELREAAAALWRLLHRSVRNRDKQTLPVGLVTPDGCITPPRWSLTELLAPLNPLRECEEVTRVQTGQSDVLAGTAATQKW
jgi:hypothetical protein